MNQVFRGKWLRCMIALGLAAHDADGLLTP